MVADINDWTEVDQDVFREAQRLLEAGDQDGLSALLERLVAESDR